MTLRTKRLTGQAAGMPGSFGCAVHNSNPDYLQIVRLLDRTTVALRRSTCTVTPADAPGRDATTQVRDPNNPSSERDEHRASDGLA